MTDPPEPPVAWVPPVAQPVPPPVRTPLLAPPPPGSNPYAPNPYAPNPAAPQPPTGGRGPSNLAIVLIVVGVLVGLVVGLVVLFTALVSSIQPYDPPVSEPEPVFTPRESTAPPPTSPVGGPGDTLTTDHGVSITVETPSCVSYGNGEGETTHRRCSVPVDMVNDGLEQIKVSSIDFALYLGDARYSPTSEDSLFFGVPRSTRLDPATGGLVLLWFDVAIDGGEPTSLEFQRYGVVDTQLTVEFSQRGPAQPPAQHDENTAPLGSTLQVYPSYDTADGSLAVTVLTVQCGLPEAPAEDGPIRPEGEFCAVTATVGNGTSESQKVSGADFTLLAGGTRVTTSSPANRFDGQRRSDFVDPGAVIDCTVWFDVPVGTTPTAVRFATYYGDAATFAVP